MIQPPRSKAFGIESRSAPRAYHPGMNRRLPAVQLKPGPVLQRAAGGAARRAAGDPVTAGTAIAFSRHCTNHGHTLAEVRTQLQAAWGARRRLASRAGTPSSVAWGVGAPSGIIFFDNGNAISVTHAQSGANIAAEEAARRAAAAARAAGQGAASGNWRA